LKKRDSNLHLRNCRTLMVFDIMTCICVFWVYFLMIYVIFLNYNRFPRNNISFDLIPKRGVFFHMTTALSAVQSL